MGVTLRSVTQPSAASRPEGANALGSHSRIAVSRIRLALGVALLVASAIGGHFLLGEQNSRVSVLVMAKNLASGSTISSSDFEVREVSDLAGVTYLGSDADVIGQRVQRDLFAGEFIPANALVNPSVMNRRLISIPLAAGHVPVVDSGQLVDVWMTPGADGVAAPGPPQMILENAVVETGSVDTDPTMDGVVTISVTATDVAAVIEGMQLGVINLVVVDGNVRDLAHGS